MFGPHVDDVKISMQRFGWPDYAVFLLMLVSCSLIGIYFGFWQKKSRKSAEQAGDDYLVGGRKMSVFPVTMSLIASFVSGITLLGTPTEIYVYGTAYVFIVFGVLLMGIVMSAIYMPVFHELKLTSTYEYLHMRFDNKVRLFGAVMYVFGSLMWLPIVIYVPALAFNQVTGINVHLVTPIVCLVCIFYTSIGGLKAVVWTDVVQLIIMFGAIMLVIVKGTSDIGGLSVVWDRATNGERIEGPDMNFDLKSRYTIYSLTLGGFAHWLKSQAVSQNMIQRYLSLPTLKMAQRSLWLFILGVLMLLAMCSYCGLLIYATYFECDPLTTKLARAKDQLLPLLVMDILGDFPGLPGLFVAGVFSAALSSLSTGLNSLSAVVLEDFCKPLLSSRDALTERQTKNLLRGVVAGLGCVCVGLVLIVEKLGAVLQLSMSLSSVTNGPLLGIFTLGVAVPWVHGTGAIVGGSVGLGFMTWLCLQAQTALATGRMAYAEKPVTTMGCAYTYLTAESMNMLAATATTEAPVESMPVAADDSFQLYHISYLWYTLLGAVITIAVAVVVSFATGANDPRKVDGKLLAPCVRRLIRYERNAAEVDANGAEVLGNGDLRMEQVVAMRRIS